MKPRTRGTMTPTTRTGETMNQIATNETIPNTCLQSLRDPDFVRENVYIGLQRASDMPLIKRPGMLEGTEQYLYVRGTEGGTSWRAWLKELPSHDLDLTEQEAWECAAANTSAAGMTVIDSLPQLLTSITGVDLPEDTECGLRMYVLTNPQRAFGSAQLTDTATIRRYFRTRLPGCKKLVVIPSSVHECILVPVPEGTSVDLEDFHAMVREVNATLVDESEQLGDTCQIMEI